MIFIFENLEVYKKSLELVDIFTAILDNMEGNKSLKDQLNRASLSITLNIAEGSGRFTKAEKRSFYIIARGSIYECVACVQILLNKKHIDLETYSRIYKQLEKLSKMINALINSLEK